MENKFSIYYLLLDKRVEKRRDTVESTHKFVAQANTFKTFDPSEVKKDDIQEMTEEEHQTLQVSVSYYFNHK